MVFAVFAGCAEELGPPRRATTRVTGSVHEGRSPVSGGWIEFLPAGSTVGNMRSAPSTDTDGSRRTASPWG